MRYKFSPLNKAMISADYLLPALANQRSAMVRFFICIGIVAIYGRILSKSTWRG